MLEMYNVIDIVVLFIYIFFLISFHFLFIVEIRPHLVQLNFVVFFYNDNKRNLI